jgi:RNA polymerase sigma factor (sigma-70 family)
VSINQDDKAGSAFLHVFLTYRPWLAKMVSKIVKPSDVEDIVQETFVRTFMVDNSRNIKHPKAFMYRTAKNLALNFIARKDNLPTISVEDNHCSDVYLDSEQPDTRYESEEKFRIFCMAVRDLPPACRRAFILKRIYGLSLSEIAAYMGISESTVEKHVSKGLVRCADFLRARGYAINGGQKAFDVKLRSD